MKSKEYLLKIAAGAYPEIFKGKFFTVIKGAEHYFSGLHHAEVKYIYRSFYDEFDFAFSLHCRFTLSDRKCGSRWTRQEGSEHVYAAPALFVVDRMEMNYAPAQLVSRMQHHYRANTLVLGTYRHPQFTMKQLEECMDESGINFIRRKDLEEKSFNAVYSLQPFDSW
jgi:hypothetical protein